MLTVKIAKAKKPDEVLYSEKFSDLAELASWLKYQIPSFDTESLQVNSKKTHFDYVVSLESETELPEVSAGSEIEAETVRKVRKAVPEKPE